MSSKAQKRPTVYDGIDLSQTPYERVKTLLDGLAKDPTYNGWDVRALKQFEIVSAAEGRVEFKGTVTEEMANKSGMLHGGCAATFLDIFSSMCLMTTAKPGYMDGGSVSRTFLCSFLAAVPINSNIRVICEVTRGGKRLSNVRGEIRTMDGQLAVTFSHDKVEVPRAKM